MGRVKCFKTKLKNVWNLKNDVQDVEKCKVPSSKPTLGLINLSRKGIAFIWPAQWVEEIRGDENFRLRHFETCLKCLECLDQRRQKTFFGCLAKCVYCHDWLVTCISTFVLSLNLRKREVRFARKSSPWFVSPNSFYKSYFINGFYSLFLSSLDVWQKIPRFIRGLFNQQGKSMCSIFRRFMINTD